jgi:outer membrane protein OmpA-like peptidoglycan-associated protein
MTMKFRTKGIIFISLFCLITGLAFSQEEDVEGSQDHPLLSRMENFYISGYEEFEYESHDFYDAEDNEYIIEGHKWVIEYTLKEGLTPPGQLKVRRNYINAIKEIGGTILFDKGVYMKVATNNKETWIEVWASSDGSDYRLTIVERTIMEQEVAADPAALAGDIRTSGRAKVYGIYFDLDSHEIKPESDPTLQAIADMLNANESLKIYVVGHTDMTGQLDYNMELSRRRAESVVDALVNSHGIAADRLQAQGVGPLSPVSTNNTEEGRKLNRRVELVEMK